MKQQDVFAESLSGWWKISTFRVEFEDGGESADTYGAHPLGFMVIDRGRMMTILTARERVATDPARLFETLISYTGSCRVEDGNRLVISVDTAWHPSWVGTEQVRSFEVDGDGLAITTAWQTHPLFPGRTARGVLTAKRWEPT